MDIEECATAPGTSGDESEINHIRSHSGVGTNGGPVPTSRRAEAWKTYLLAKGRCPLEAERIRMQTPQPLARIVRAGRNHESRRAPDTKGRNIDSF